MRGRTGDVLIDSGGWVQFLRRSGDPKIKQRVRELMDAGRATWCDVIQLELWRGALDEMDRRILQGLQADIPSLDISAEVWKLSISLGAKCRPRGISVPAADLIIFACAEVHQVELYHLDKHFELIKALLKP